MNTRRAAAWTVGLLLLSRAAAAETRDRCLQGDCEYRFDDEDVNAPGWSAYVDWMKVHGPAKTSRLIRPRISFVMELVKSTQSVW